MQINWTFNIKTKNANELVVVLKKKVLISQYFARFSTRGPKEQLNTIEA